MEQEKSAYVYEKMVKRGDERLKEIKKNTERYYTIIAEKGEAIDEMTTMSLEVRTYLRVMKDFTSYKKGAILLEPKRDFIVYEPTDLKFKELNIQEYHDLNSAIFNENHQAYPYDKQYDLSKIEIKKRGDYLLLYDPHEANKLANWLVVSQDSIKDYLEKTDD